MCVARLGGEDPGVEWQACVEFKNVGHCDAMCHPRTLELSSVIIHVDSHEHDFKDFKKKDLIVWNMEQGFREE